jgi:hypothetical protein
MSEAAKIAEHIQQHLPYVKSGTLKFFGQWFGRPYDNVHEIESAAAKDNCLIIEFRGQESLGIWDPCGFRISKTEFQINSASRVLWMWYYYGRPQTMENLRYIDYFFERTDVMVKSNFDDYERILLSRQDELAVKIY